MDQENTSLAASTTETLMRPTKSSTTMFEAQKTRPFMDQENTSLAASTTE